MNICSETVESEPLIDNDELEDHAVNLYIYVKELATLKCEAELRREDSLIQQSSHMQTAFFYERCTVYGRANINRQLRKSVLFELLFCSILF